MPRSAAVPDFDPTDIAGVPKTHNQPPYLAIFTEIDDLYEEAKNWADGEAISSQEMHDQIEKLYDGLHEAGKRADALRVEEKKPLDEKVKEIQDRYNRYIQPKKGRVDLAKSTLGSLLAPWRKKVADEKAAEAEKKAAEAAVALAEAQAAIRSSSGNLGAREYAEELLADAKKLERGARRADRAATTGTGLRTVWNVNIADEDKALEWAYTLAPGEFMALALSMAEEQVRGGVRSIEGFSIVEDKVAR